MGDKLAVVLIQLPPRLAYEEKLLTRFLADLSAAARRSGVRTRYALEPRHESWMESGNLARIRILLRKARIALVFAHSSKIPSYPPVDENLTTDFVYLRFHGPSEFAASAYGARRLAPFAKRMREWRRQGVATFTYFNNDVHGHAVDDARILRRLCLHEDR